MNFRPAFDVLKPTKGKVIIFILIAAVGLIDLWHVYWLVNGVMLQLVDPQAPFKLMMLTLLSVPLLAPFMLVSYVFQAALRNGHPMPVVSFMSNVMGHYPIYLLIGLAILIPYWYVLACVVCALYKRALTRIKAS
jgi:hypothetical protein